MISHHAWPGGLAMVAESDRGAAAAVFGPDGWRLGDPRHVIPQGLPDGSTSDTLDLPAWLLEQALAMDLTWAGLHTEFVRLDRLVDFLRAEGTSGAVLVLGESPAAVVLRDGRSEVVFPGERGSAPESAALGNADGWIVVLSGRLEVPSPAADGIVARDAPAAAAPRPGGEPCYIAALDTTEDLPMEVRDDIRASAGEAGLAVPGLLDGKRTPSEIAEATGLTTGQVVAAVGILVRHRLAFRYLRRGRLPAGPKPAAPAGRPGEV